MQDLTKNERLRRSRDFSDKDDLPQAQVSCQATCLHNMYTACPLDIPRHSANVMLQSSRAVPQVQQVSLHHLPGTTWLRFALVTLLNLDLNVRYKCALQHV